jgi:D-amino-acid dehydrogenase
MSQRPHVIVGGGIIGLFTAFYLLESAKKIVIIEKSDGEEGCSFGNAGMVVPSHFIPLASPGMIEKGLKWMLDSESPFYVKPRLSLELVKWGLHFYKNANQKHVDKSIPYLRDLGLISKSLYHGLANELKYSYEEKGLLMYCKKNETFEEECITADLANSIGLKAEILDSKAIHTLEPHIKPDVAGGIYFPGDAHLNPKELVKNLKGYLLNKGVEINYNAELTDFYENNGKIEKLKLTYKGEERLIEPETLTIAAGSWSGVLAKKLRFNLPMQAGKGYSISKNQVAGKEILIPNILVEARVAITPMSGSFVRFGGTMEIGGLDDTINMKRVKGIVKSIPDYFPEYDLPMPKQEEVWYGFRPCSPDGLPYIGASGVFTNLFINSGHAMMGISLAPGSGKLMSQIIIKEKPEMALEGFLPERFGI